jgi:hypothetical protein
MTGVRCDDTSAWCLRPDRGAEHAPLPTSCVQDPILDTPYWKHERSVPCSFYRVVRELCERMPVSPAYWIKPLMPPMGYAAPVASCAGREGP